MLLLHVLHQCGSDALAVEAFIDKQRAYKAFIQHADKTGDLLVVQINPGFGARQIAFTHQLGGLLPIIGRDKRMGLGGACQPQRHQRLDIGRNGGADHAWRCFGWQKQPVR
ncbi:hypothetical protein D3C75_819440 [compost metagenome]